MRRSLAIGVLALAFAGAADAATTLSIAPGTARYGANATFSGTVTPAAGGVSVQIVSAATSHSIGSTTTAADGTFTVALAVLRGGQYTAVASTGTSPAASLQMIPSLVAKVYGKRVLGGKLAVRGRLRPTAAKGHLRLTVRGKTRNVHVGAEGWFRISLPSDRAGRTKWSLALSPAAGYESVRRKGAPVLRGPRLSYGSRGLSVRLLEKRLAELHYTLARVDSVYGIDTFQAVMAFQKLRGLARTGRVDAGFWRLLSRAGIPKAFVPSGTHIEISKTKQIMFEVVDGKVARVAHVSTGATGNTPVGRFRVYYLHPGYNAKGMYYSLFFRGNFAIHGYKSVPAYQASHGCVRTPIWYARGFYDRWAHIGTQVMIFG